MRQGPPVAEARHFLDLHRRTTKSFCGEEPRRALCIHLHSLAKEFQPPFSRCFDLLNHNQPLPPFALPFTTRIVRTSQHAVDHHFRQHHLQPFHHLSIPILTEHSIPDGTTTQFQTSLISILRPVSSPLLPTCFLPSFPFPPFRSLLDKLRDTTEILRIEHGPLPNTHKRHT